MANLNLSTIELVSTLRAAPLNGSPSSQDYNDSWTESLADLASLAGFIDDIIIPMLNGLISTIQPTSSIVPNGIEGRYIYSDTSDTSQVFYNNLAGSSLSIADSFRILEGIIVTIQSTLNDLNVEVVALQTSLSSTNQNDVAQALQNVSATLQSLQSQTITNTRAIASNIVQFMTNGVGNSIQNKLNLAEGTHITLSESNGTVIINSSGGGTGSGGTVWYSGNGVPVTLYNDGDFYLDLLTGNVYEQAGGSWVWDMLIKGSAGATGATGATGPTATLKELAFFASGTGTNNQLLFRGPLGLSISFHPANTGSYESSASNVAGATAAYTLTKYGATGAFATATFPTGSTGPAVWSQSSTASFAAHDILIVAGPATADTTLTDVCLTIVGNG